MKIYDGPGRYADRAISAEQSDTLTGLGPYRSVTFVNGPNGELTGQTARRVCALALAGVPVPQWRSGGGGGFGS
jgi:hypothetical protein